jgi:hypothetical protein
MDDRSGRAGPGRPAGRRDHVVSLQEYEDHYAVRVKFACVDKRDHTSLVRYASEEYEGFFREPPLLGWKVGRKNSVRTRGESRRPARQLRGPSGEDFVAVEHETGLEILMLAMALPGTAVAVVQLLDRWRDRRRRRKHPTVEDVVVVERRETASDGTITSTTITVPNEVATRERLQELLLTDSRAG